MGILTRIWRWYQRGAAIQDRIDAARADAIRKTGYNGRFI